MQLIYYPDPILHRVCNKAPDKRRQDRARLAAKMWKIMNDNNGVGLAAPQVGLNSRVFVWKQDRYNQVIWNPSLIYVSGNIKSNEGCLSLPKIRVTMQRATSSILTGTGINNKPLRFIGNAITTQIFQHEIEHLDGKLIIDAMNTKETAENKDALDTLLKTK